MKEIYKTSILEEIIQVLILRIENKQFSTKFNVTNMNESKNIFIEMQDQYERLLSMMLQR